MIRFSVNHHENRMNGLQRLEEDKKYRGKTTSVTSSSLFFRVYSRDYTYYKVLYHGGKYQAQIHTNFFFVIAKYWKNKSDGVQT